MSALLKSRVAQWLQAEACAEPSIYKTRFAEHHLGNIFIRSLHGGVSGSMIELCAEAETRKSVGDDAKLMVTSTATDYLRITRDVDLYAKAEIQRLSRRLCVVDVTCWQDDKDKPVARGIVTIKIEPEA